MHLLDPNNCSSSTIDWDIADFNLPQIADVHDFQMWPDGPMKLIYESGKNEQVRRHLSGWAMRNTNNHNRDILKKSCLGVLMCKDNCIIAETGERVALRPAICDKARKKQMNHKCPNCGGGVMLQSCKGNAGYPVTHYWRRDSDRVFFQSKGYHDHLRPDLRPHRDNRRKANDFDSIYKETNFASSSTPDSASFLKKDVYCSTCLQYNCECQKNLNQLRCQLLRSRHPAGVFFNPYPYQGNVYNHHNYYKFTNYFIGQDQPSSFYPPETFVPNTALPYPHVIPTSSLAFIKSDELSKQFQLDPFVINRYPSSYPTPLPTPQTNPINYSNARSSTTCRYPAQEALSSNIQSTNLSMPYFKY